MESLDLIRLRKNNLKLTQRQLADKLGYTRRQIGKFERGEAPIPIIVRLALASLVLGLEDFRDLPDLEAAAVRLLTLAVAEAPAAA